VSFSFTVTIRYNQTPAFIGTNDIVITNKHKGYMKNEQTCDNTIADCSIYADVSKVSLTTIS